MITFSIKINKKYALDILLFHFLRSFKDGLSLLNVDVGADWYKGDHNPKVILRVVLINVTIIEINIYNTGHIS